MPAMHVKAVITDLDRTLLRTDKSLSPYTADVLRRCRAAGMRVMAATARPERSVRAMCAAVAFDAMAVTNGARILLPDRVEEHAIPRGDAARIFAALRAEGDVLLSAETSEGFFATRDIPEWEPRLMRDLGDLPPEAEIYKLLADGTDSRIREAAAAALCGDTYMTVAGGDLIQIMHHTASKWRGVCAMLDAFGIAPADAVYFGDDNDDVECLSLCGTGAAVANAIDAARAAADVTVGTNDDEGPAYFIEENFLRG